MADRRFFLDLADDLSLAEADLAAVVGSFWEDYLWPPDYGNIILFDRLGINSGRDRGRRAIQELGSMLSIEFAPRVSALFLKAFPLEFESNLTVDDVLGQRFFERRRRAMKRLYGVAFGCEELPDAGSLMGWMWRSYRYSPPPLAQPDLTWIDEEN
jgi:hypothetical protein